RTSETRVVRDPQCFLTPLHSAQRQFLRMAKTAIGSADALPWGLIGDVSQDDCGWAASGLRSAKLRGHAVKSQVGVGADRRNGGQANNDDQRQHDRVLDGSRAVFVDQKMTGVTKEIGHERTFRETCDEDERDKGRAGPTVLSYSPALRAEAVLADGKNPHQR